MTCPPCTHDCREGRDCPARNRDEIIEMAEQAGFDCYGKHITWDDVICTDELEAFAKLVAAKTIAELESQEPMFLFQSHRDNFWCVDLTCKKCYSADFRLMYTHPPQRTWIGLMDEEVLKFQDIVPNSYSIDLIAFAKAIEAKLKEKNNA